MFDTLKISVLIRTSKIEVQILPLDEPTSLKKAEITPLTIELLLDYGFPPYPPPLPVVFYQ